MLDQQIVDRFEHISNSFTPPVKDSRLAELACPGQESVRVRNKEQLDRMIRWYYGGRDGVRKELLRRKMNKDRGAAKVSGTPAA